MDVSRKTDYALRMLAMLVSEPDGIVSVRAAADDNGVPYSFARSIQHDLVRAGIIESLRGARGGMHLAVDADKLTLLQVVEAIQGPVSFSACGSVGPDGGVCPRANICRFNPIWDGSRELLASYLSSVTLAEIVRGTARPYVDERFARPGGSGRVPVTQASAPRSAGASAAACAAKCPGGSACQGARVAVANAG